MTFIGDNVGLNDPWATGAEVTVDIVGPLGVPYGPLTTYVGMDVDGSWSCHFTLSDDPVFAVGDYTYTARAVGSTTVQGGSFTDADNTPPVVTATSITPSSPDPSRSSQVSRLKEATATS